MQSDRWKMEPLQESHISASPCMTDQNKRMDSRCQSDSSVYCLDDLFDNEIHLSLCFSLVKNKFLLKRFPVRGFNWADAHPIFRWEREIDMLAKLFHYGQVDFPSFLRLTAQGKSLRKIESKQNTWKCIAMHIELKHSIVRQGKNKKCKLGCGTRYWLKKETQRNRDVFDKKNKIKNRMNTVFRRAIFLVLKELRKGVKQTRLQYSSRFISLLRLLVFFSFGSFLKSSVPIYGDQFTIMYTVDPQSLRLFDCKASVLYINTRT